ncbi:MAG TPA: MFS transporter [Solirubrobacteraceae bacterium]|nr:MFS transporter [Solirubrobacteraceae bacterium]
MRGGVQVHVPATLRAAEPFRLLFAGQALSVIGDRITPVAIAFAVLAIGDVTDLGIVLAAGGVPFALFAIAGGVVSDRVGRREVMIASDLIRTVSQGVTAALLLSGRAEVWMLVVLSAVYGTSAAVFMPALIGLIPQTVPPERLQEANALLGVTRSVAHVAGPALAGVIIAIGGPGEAIALDAVTFALSAACLLALRPHADAAGPAEEEEDRFTARLRTGWREVRARPWLTWGLAAMAAYHVFVLPAVFALGPALAEAELSGASSWAAIVACFGIGTVTGNLIALRLRPHRPVLVAAIALVGGCTQAAIIGSGLGTPGIAALMVLAGIAVSLFFTLWDTSLQEQIPPHAVSRVSSYDFTVSLGLMPIGMALAGPIAGEFGLHATLLLMSAAGAAVALTWLAVPDVRRVRRPAPEPPAALEDAGLGLEPQSAPAATGGDGRRFERRRSAVEET